MKSKKQIVRFYNWQDWNKNALAPKGLGGWLGSDVTIGSFLKLAAAEAEVETNDVWILAASKNERWRVSAWIKLRKRLPNEPKSNSDWATLVYYDMTASLFIGDVKLNKLLDIPEINDILRGCGKKLEQQGMAGYEFTGESGKSIYNTMRSIAGTPFLSYASETDTKLPEFTRMDPPPAAENNVANREINTERILSVSDHSLSNVENDVRLTQYRFELEATLTQIENEYANKPGQDIDVIVKRRIGQGPFRSLLEEFHGVRCCISGITNRRLLIASHIVPWSEASSTQKTDHENGLLLSVIWDALFDKGFVSFDNDGTLLCSERLDDETALRLGIALDARLPVDMLTERRKKNLSWHRNNFGFKA